MLAPTLAPVRQRGVILLMVLAILALMALIGVTFATFAGQGKISARNFALSILTPQPDVLLDFALQQLIADTGDVRSALRGHSLARDMFGNDARDNGYLAANPSTGAPFTITNIQPVANSAGLYDFQTSIAVPARDPTFYGYNFTRWALRLTYTGNAIPRPVDQTFEILYDNYQAGDTSTAFTGGGFHVFRVTPIDATTALNNPTAAAQNGLAAWLNLLVQPQAGAARFILDGRRLRAFNGPGLGPAAAYGNFRYNGGLLSGNASLTQPGNPDAVGMDEDYDACDLENWFLAIQSADGQVIIPSFHRPGIIRHDPSHGVSDWARTNPAANWADSASRILRPVAADGHDPATFPDLVPDPATGQITFDVDNDADGVTDSVWLDLGYPARTDPGGRLYKPLFAFLVIGLNGRIPLNAAGNLAGASPTGATHATHLGNSVSEIDPTYALQNANQGPAIDADPFNLTGIGAPPYTSNTQVDNAGIDVRLTQLRNLLAGTRPQPNPTTSDPLLADPRGTTNGDDNFVFGTWGGIGGGQPYYMPNGIADPGDILIGTNPPRVQRTTPPVPGRWGEAPWIPGTPFTGSGGQVLNLVAGVYNNPVRAGYSFGITDLLNGAPRAAADDNYNQFDPFPIGHSGEVDDRDLFDSAGGLLLPVDRMRRFVTPVDIDGSGRMLRWGVPWPAGDVGADAFGRVDFAGYFRPPGSPGAIGVGSGATPGAITYPSAGNDLFYTSGPNPANLSFPSYLPDVTNNPLHGFEAAKNPNLPVAGGGYAPQAIGGMPADQNNPAGIPGDYPTYDLNIRTNGLNEADEMNLYQPNALLDSPYGPADLEWLYRPQVVGDQSMSNRLANLAPISFTNGVDGMRRRRLFALDSWESDRYAWANDNPLNAFPFNSRFLPTASPSFAVVSTALGSFVAAPTLAHRDRKINLNYPLPVSNDPDEPIRRKWINDTYQLLKWILPPRAVDTPEELAQLSQFVINIVDFRDPDGTMTHWQNPDVLLVPGQPANPSGNPPTPATGPVLVAASLGPDNAIPLDQYGMEYNPVALNEVLAFSYAYFVGSSGGPGSQANRFFVEMVNTLTQSSFAALPAPAPGVTNPPDPSILDLGGLQYTAGDPYSGGCWDLVFTDDTPNSRPDPYRGELVQGGSFYSLIPLNRDSFTMSATPPAAGSSSSSGSDVKLVPLGPAGVLSPSVGNPATNPPTPPTNFFYAFGNSPSNPTYETGTPSPTTYYPATNGSAANTPSLVQFLSPAADPFNGSASPKITWYPGVLPGVVAAFGDSSGSAPPTYQAKLPTVTAGSQKTKYYWVCLRRPANPFAPVSAANPMLVVDAMRFPYIDGTAPLTGTGPKGGPPTVPNLTASQVNTVYSAQRFQPYRGGHAVPVATAATANGTAPTPTLDARYGYTEQIAAPTGYSNQLGTQGIYFIDSSDNKIPIPYYSTNPIYHTLGIANDQAEYWDFLPLHDRDFTGVAELMLVPGCPPGLFTKQFAEFAPGRSGSGLFAQVTPLSAPPSIITPFATAATAFVTGSAVNPMPAHTFPYLADRFFYTGASTAADTGGTLVGSPTGDGWFKMFEFFEVPGAMMGAIGPVAQGTDFDWQRQDTRPGLLNLNLIIDEEVFFSVAGRQDAGFNQHWLNFIQVPSISPGTYSLPLNGKTPIPQYGPPVPLVVSAIDANGAPAYVYPIANRGVTATDPILATAGQGNPSGPVGIVDSRIKAAFAQFLWLRHGGSGYLFGFGTGAVGQNNAVTPIDPLSPMPSGYGSGIPAERPFRSLSFPDIDYTVMRPATLPPSIYTNPPITYQTIYTADPGVRNPNLYPGYATQGIPTGSVAAGGLPAYPGAIPVRRLFQVPDANAESNASESGDSFIDNQEPMPPATMTANVPPPAPGALPPVTVAINGSAGTFAFNNGYPNLMWSIWPGNGFPANSGGPATSVGLGQPSNPSSPLLDAREHPSWRIEMLQRVMNLTTVRTHQYAVWITVGFFEVMRRGDVGMIASGDPRLAFDILGPEIGVPGDGNRRYRSFFLVDRLKLDGFDPTTSGRWQSAVVDRQRIQ